MGNNEELFIEHLRPLPNSQIYPYPPRKQVLPVKGIGEVYELCKEPGLVLPTPIIVRKELRTPCLNRQHERIKHPHIIATLDQLFGYRIDGGLTRVVDVFPDSKSHHRDLLQTDLLADQPEAFPREVDNMNVHELVNFTQM